ASLLFAGVALAENQIRTFDGTYTATLTGIPGDAGVLNIWIPIPTTRGEQQISDIKIDSPFTWTRMRENEFGDEYIVAKVPAPQTGELTVRVNFHATRKGVAYPPSAAATPSRSELDRALRADHLVTLSPRIRKIADEVTAGKTSVTDQAQAIYQY